MTLTFIPTHRDEAIEKVAKKLFEMFDNFYNKNWEEFCKDFRLKENIYLEAGEMIIKMIEEDEI